MADRPKIAAIVTEYLYEPKAVGRISTRNMALLQIGSNDQSALSRSRLSRLLPRR
jgi:hypothetical protein